eukprot:TRINITY_DN8891_c0_g1_i1.p1 TRINITY_DN8891_c0_g1~~TRINITY_DN8891_c0_g1_i1.p1  ORF type:complete len:204 (-),score=83.96 TRINITY_DN8891_c0_g1_i1:72-656(-)
MKFKLCGDLDAPEWFLKEISVLTKLSCVRVKLLSIQIVKYLLGEQIDYQKVAKMTKVAELGASDVKALMAALTFIVVNSAKYNILEETLRTELEQLGMPKETCGSLVRSYRQHKDKLRTLFESQTLQLPRLDSVDWRVDYLLSSSSVEEINQPSVQLQLVIDGETHSFEVEDNKFRILYQELKNVQSMIESMNV